MADDRVAVADGRVAVDQIGKLAARCLRRVEDVFMAEGQAAKLEVGKTLSPNGL
jgi:hypothetical protein